MSCLTEMSNLPHMILKHFLKKNRSEKKNEQIELQDLNFTFQCPNFQQWFGEWLGGRVYLLQRRTHTWSPSEPPQRNYCHSTTAHVQVGRESGWLFKDFSLIEGDSNTQEVNYADYGNIPLVWNNNFRKIGIKKSIWLHTVSLLYTLLVYIWLLRDL